MNSDLHPQLADLTTSIDTLQAALAPVLTTALSTSASKLPLLDKAKLYALTTYAIESLLFSYLRLHGQDAKTHPVFAELSRVKAYFGKIQAAESAGAGSSGPSTKQQPQSRRLDADAAGRFIRHGLAGNDQYDASRADARAREVAGAKRRLDDLPSVGTHTRFDGVAKRLRVREEDGDGRQRLQERVAVVSATGLDDSEDGDEGEDDVDGVGGRGGAVEVSGKKGKRGKKARRDENFGAMAGLEEALVKAAGTAATTMEDDWSDHVRVPAGGDAQVLPKDEAKRLRRLAKKERKKLRSGEEARANEMK